MSGSGFNPALVHIAGYVADVAIADHAPATWVFAISLTGDRPGADTVRQGKGRLAGRKAMPPQSYAILLTLWRVGMKNADALFGGKTMLRNLRRLGRARQAAEERCRFSYLIAAVERIRARKPPHRK